MKVTLCLTAAGLCGAAAVTAPDPWLCFSMALAGLFFLAVSFVPSALDQVDRELDEGQVAYLTPEQVLAREAARKGHRS